MNKGIITAFFYYVFNSFSQWFDSSILGKAGRWVGRVWKKITLNSFFVNWFTNGSEECSYRDTSYIFRIFKVISGVLKKIGKFFVPFIEKSVVINSLKWFYDGILKISVSYYGIFLLFFSTFYACFGIFGKCIGKSGLIICALLFALSIVLIAINRSVSQILSGSIAANIFMKFLKIDVDSYANEYRELKIKSSVCFALVGLICAFLSSKLGFIYGFGIVAAIIFTGAVIYNFAVGVYAALIALPFAPTMALVGIMLLTIISFIIKYCVTPEYKFRRTSLDIPIAIFLVVLLISTVTSFAVSNSVKIYLVYFVFIASYYTITNAFDDFKKLFPILVIMLVAGLCVSGYGIYQHIFGFAEGTTWTDTDMFEDIATRVVSTFDNPNVLGEYLLLLIPLGAAMFLSVKGGFAKTAHLAMTAALGVCMIYTYSRGNWIGLIMAFIVFILFYDTRFVWLGVIAILCAPFLLSENVITRFLSIGDTKDTSTSYRVYIWMGTLAMLKDYWLCGIGLGSDAFNMVYPHYSYAGIVAPHSHNLYLQLLVENGIIGLVVFLVIIFAYYKSVISKITFCNRGIEKASVTALAAGIFGFLVQGMFDNVWYNYRVFFMFFAILGLTMAAVCSSKGGNEDD